MKNATISDVAKLSGVSKSTVSNYLNGNFERMSDETKKKIKNAIDELGYTPSLSARRLSSKNHSKTVCLAIPRNISHLNDTMYYPVIFSALGEEAKKFDYCRLPRYLTNPGQRRSEWDMAGSDGISRVSAVFRGKSLLANKMRII